MADRNQKWEIDLFEIGKCESCLYSWFCTACAITDARSKMDGSGCCFNFMAIKNPVVIHWLMRSAYGIPSDNECVDDCMIPTCCTFCAVNQMYQTAMIRENPSTDGGSRFNLKAFSHESNKYSCNECMYAMCCCPCAIGTTLSNTVGMPFLMGCCCVSLCGARNIVRYQYRIGGDECFDDYCTPVMVCSVSYCAVACTSIFVPCVCCWPCIPCCLGAIFGVYSYFVAVVMKILQESEVQLKARGGVPGFYLSSSPASSMNDNRAMLPSTTVYVNNNHVTFPSNAHYAQVVPTNELSNHSGGGGPGFYLSSSPASALNDNRAMLPSNTVYVNNNHVTFPSNAHYAQVVPTNELGNHAGGGSGQYSYVPTAVAAEESSNTVNKNYD